MLEKFCVININVVTKTYVNLLKNSGLYHKDTSCFIEEPKDEDELLRVQIRTAKHFPLERAAQELHSLDKGWRRGGECSLQK